jgi:hypothetical protein
MKTINVDTFAKPYVTYVPNFINMFGCEWVIVVNANSAIFQLYHGENKLIFKEMMTRSALHQYA